MRFFFSSVLDRAFIFSNPNQSRAFITEDESDKNGILSRVAHHAVTIPIPTSQKKENKKPKIVNQKLQ